MEVDKENKILGSSSHRNRRRSSILKDPSGRKPLESLESNLQRRRSLKRVSFADTNTVKIGDAAAADIVEPLEHFSTDQDREQNNHRKENSNYTSAFIGQFMGLSPVHCCQPEPLTVGAVASCEEIPLKDDTADSQDFLAKFLNLVPSVSVTDDLYRREETKKIDEYMEMTYSTGEMAGLTQGVRTHNITMDKGKTCSADHMAGLMQGDVNEMEMTNPASQVVRLIQDGMTDMERIFPVSQVAKLTQGDMTEKINSDMEMTCPVSQVAKLTQREMMKIITRVEISNPARHLALSSQYVTPGIDMSCPRHNTADLDISIPRGPMTQMTQDNLSWKVTAGLESASPVVQAFNSSRNNLIKKITVDKEVTFETDHNSADKKEIFETNHDTADKEVTCETDHKTADKEVTCETDHITTDKKVTCVTDLISTDKEVTCETDRITTEKEVACETDLSTAEKEVTCETDHITTDKEITCETDHITTDKEITCETDNITTNNVTAEETTCEANHITSEIQDKSLQRRIKDIECNCPVGQVPDLSQNDLNQKVRNHLKITPQAGEMTRLTRDNPHQVIIADKELNYTAGQMDSLWQHHPFQRKSTQVEFSSPVFQNAKFIHDDMTKTMTADIEMKYPSSHVISRTENDSAQIRITDVEGTFPADQVAAFTENDQIQVITHKEAITQLGHRADPFLPDQSKDFSTFSHLDNIFNFSLPIFQSFSVKPKDYEKENDTESEIKQNGFDDADSISLNCKIFRKECLAEKALLSPDQSQLCGKRLHASVSTDEPVPKCFVSDVSHYSSSHTCLSPLLPPQVGSHSLFLSQDGSHLKSTTQMRSYALSPSKTTSRYSSVHLPLPQTGPHSLNLSQVDPLPQTGSHSSYLSSHKQHFLLDSSINEGMSTVSDIPEVPYHGAEELINDINLSLINISNNSTEISPLTGDLNDKVSSQTFVPKEGKVKEQNRRKSLAAHAVDQVMPLITSFIEHVSMLHNNQSDLEMQCREMSATDSDVCPTERSMANLSFQYMNKSTNLTLHQTDKCTAKVSLLSSPPLDIKSIANISELDPELLLAFSASNANHCTHMICSHADMKLKSADEMSKARSGDEILFSDTQRYDADSAGNPVDEPEVWIEGDQCEKVENKSDTEKMLYKEVSLCKVSDKTEEQHHCSSGCYLTPGTMIFTPSNEFLWVVKDIYEGERYLMLQNSPLELGLNVIRCNSHWRVSSAAWSPQASKVSNACGKLILNVLGCRLESAVAKLDGLFLCEIGDILSKLSAVYQDIFNMMVELQMVKTSYLTLFLEDSIKVTLFSLEGHVSVDVLLQLQPPAPNTDELYTLHPCATITVGNLRHQTVEETMAGVVPGPRQLLRLVQAVNFIVQSVAH